MELRLRHFTGVTPGEHGLVTGGSASLFEPFPEDVLSASPPSEFAVFQVESHSGQAYFCASLAAEVRPKTLENGGQWVSSVGKSRPVRPGACKNLPRAVDFYLLVPDKTFFQMLVGALKKYVPSSHININRV